MLFGTWSSEAGTTFGPLAEQRRHQISEVGRAPRRLVALRNPQARDGRESAGLDLVFHAVEGSRLTLESQNI
jgi:hypothetical protein